MAKKDEADKVESNMPSAETVDVEKKYVVVSGVAGKYFQGEEVTEKEVGESFKWWLATGTIALATPEEIAGGDPGDIDSLARSAALTTGDDKVAEFNTRAVDAENDKQVAEAAADGVVAEGASGKDINAFKVEEQKEAK